MEYKKPHTFPIIVNNCVFCKCLHKLYTLILFLTAYVFTCYLIKQKRKQKIKYKKEIKKKNVIVERLIQFFSYIKIKLLEFNVLIITNIIFYEIQVFNEFIR
jgi:hypothetical protein